MPGKDLQELVRRRLWELARTADDAARLARWVVPSETLKRMARTGGTSFITEGLAEFLARALEVPENRVRRCRVPRRSGTDRGTRSMEALRGDRPGRRW